MEAPSELVRDRLIVDKAVCLRRADCLLIEPLGIQFAAFDPRDLRTHQCGTIFEILRANLRPDLELPMVSGQRVDMLLSLIKRGGIPAGCPGKPTIEVKFRGFEL